MKSIRCALLLSAILTLPALGQDLPPKIGAADANSFVNQAVIVTGKVAQVTFREKLTFLNLDKPFPQTPLTAVIFSTHTNLFDDLSKLKGRAVEISGRITMHNDKPQIVIEKKAQLKVTSQSGEAEKDPAKSSP